MFPWRNLVVLAMVTVLPVSLVAADTEAAMLRSTGGVLVNRGPAPASIALFRNSLVETPKNTVARIEMTGSTADINPETLLQFESDELVLDHGSVSVNTSRLLRVRVGCITVTPVNAEWTQYDVIDTDGKVTVSAHKNDVYIDSNSKNPNEAKQPSNSNRLIVHEGEQKSREEKCGAPPIKLSERVDARGAWMNSPDARIVGTGIIAFITCYALCRSDDPISPWQP